MKKIGIYPGTFQPADKSHVNVYKKLKSLVGGDTFIATTDREPVPEAPLNFGDKQQIWVRHGVPASHIIKVNSLPIDGKGEWQPQEIFKQFPAHQTVAIIVLNEKDAGQFASRKKTNTNQYDAMSSEIRQELQEIYNELRNERTGDSDTTNQEIWMDSKGTPSYFQPYKGNEKNLQPLSENAYIVIMDDTKIDGHPVSTANIRNVLGSERYDDNQKKKFFRFVFGWFDVGLYQLMVQKFRSAHQVAYSDNIQEAVYSVLKDLAEDYSSTINTPDSSTNMTSISGDDTTMNGDSQAKINSQNRQTLIKQKKELEDKSKQNKQQRDGYQTVVKNYDTFQKKNDRDALDSINKQLSQPSTQPIQPMS